MISKNPFLNAVAPPNAAFKRLQAGGFRDWQLVVDGTAAASMSFSLTDLKALGMRSQITEVACEKVGPTSRSGLGRRSPACCARRGVLPQTRYIVYTSTEEGMWESIDMQDAQDPHTLLTMGMNDGDLPVGFGGPLRLAPAAPVGLQEPESTSTTLRRPTTSRNSGKDWAASIPNMATHGTRECEKGREQGSGNRDQKSREPNSRHAKSSSGRHHGRSQTCSPHVCV